MIDEELKNQDIDERMRIFANMLLDRIEKEMIKEDLHFFQTKSIVKLGDNNHDRTQ